MLVRIQCLTFVPNLVRNCVFKIVFYETALGNEVVLDFIRNLPLDDRKRVGVDLKTVQIGYPIGMPLCRPLGSGLSEVRTSLPSKREVRSIFDFDSDRQCLIVLHAFIKTSRTTPKADLDLAKKRKAEFFIYGGGSGRK